MSKLTFRARALDATKPMPIYQPDEIPDLSDYVLANRSVPQMPTGMEKEEEMELHLQQVLSAQSSSISLASVPPSNGAVDASSLATTAEDDTPEGAATLLVTIPVPRVTEVVLRDYEHVYGARNCFKPPKQYIKIQAAFNLEPEFPDYDVDSEDELWVKSQNERAALEITNEQFERMMDRLEKQSEHQVVKLEEAKRLLDEDDEVIAAVYDYWLDKRFRSHPCSLLPQVRTERRDGNQAGSNPYIAFRRRAEKMQTRKNRKNDEESYEKMLHVRTDLKRAVTLLEMIKRREKTKREMLNLSVEIYERRYMLEDWTDDVYQQLKQEAKPMFQFSKEELRRSRGAGVHHAGVHHRKRPSSGHNHALKEWRENRADLASQEWLMKNEDEWYRPTSFPGSSHSLREAQRIAGEAKSTKKAAEESADGKFAFKRRRGCVYFAPRSKSSMVTDAAADESLRNASETSSAFHSQPIRRRSNFRYTHLYLHSERAPSRLSYVGLARRRVGRGGRVLIDRIDLPKDVRGVDPARLCGSCSVMEPRASTSDAIGEGEFNETGFRRTSQTNIASAQQWATFPAFRPASPFDDDDSAGDNEGFLLRARDPVLGESSAVAMDRQRLLESEEDPSHRRLFANVFGADGRTQLMPIRVGAPTDLYSLHREQVCAWLSRQMSCVVAAQARDKRSTQLVNGAVPLAASNGLIVTLNTENAFVACQGVMTSAGFAQFNAEVSAGRGGGPSGSDGGGGGGGLQGSGGQVAQEYYNGVGGSVGAFTCAQPTQTTTLRRQHSAATADSAGGYCAPPPQTASFSSLTNHHACRVSLVPMATLMQSENGTTFEKGPNGATTFTSSYSSRNNPHSYSLPPQPAGTPPAAIGGTPGGGAFRGATHFASVVSAAVASGRMTAQQHQRSSPSTIGGQQRRMRGTQQAPANIIGGFVNSGPPPSKAAAFGIGYSIG